MAVLLALTDTDILDWLEADSDRLEDVRGRVNIEGGTIREAVRWFIVYDATEREAGNK